MNKVTKSDLAAAHHTKGRLGPAVDALKSIDPKSLGHDSEAFANVGVFFTWLEGLLTKAEEVIEQAKHQYETRDKLLETAVSRRYFAIFSDTDLARARLRHVIETHETKRSELIKKGFSDAEIAQIIAYPQPEIDSYEQQITDLQAELVKVEAFMRDAPRYDETLLEGTGVWQIYELMKLDIS